MAVFQRADRSGTVLARKITTGNHVELSEWLHSLGLSVFDLTITDDMDGRVVVAENPPRVITLEQLAEEFIVPRRLRHEYGVTGD
jgi:hypothetical protein